MSKDGGRFVFHPEALNDAWSEDLWPRSQSSSRQIVPTQYLPYLSFDHGAHYCKGSSFSAKEHTVYYFDSCLWKSGNATSSPQTILYAHKLIVTQKSNDLAFSLMKDKS